MVIDLISKSMLGYWDVSPSISQCEYQVGKRLIYVQYPKNELPAPYLARAQETVEAVWSDIENAVLFAEQVSRHFLPEFWKIHDECTKPGARFDVYSIHYNLNIPTPIYVIGKSHDFNFEYTCYDEEDLWEESPIAKNLPKPPDNFWMSIKRIKENHFEDAT
ncbi:MAG: hypothetical protein VX447_03330 [Pseudomonadota bacterium]|uniref:hypothetical protein n=1 Tax=Gallaecimonas pentaromativorans TaxID=584787 RepID=UPI0012ED8AD3|nr:hypothetical protein [Gallaecimonas pentaromativorans]MED5523770.1 hypothetical protein [Pseudomonadota bacterium]